MRPTDEPVNAMFHTFQGLAPPRPAAEVAQEAPKPATNGGSKRITTPHACAECKRRKIRCDGRQPCGQCLGCRSPKPCYYDKHRQRVIPSRKTLDALQQSLDECRSILKKLYPNTDVQTLLPLSRHELVSILDHRTSAPSISQTSPAGSMNSATTQEYRSPNSSGVEEDRSLATLEQIPSQDTEWDEERRNREAIPSESDDVNALSLSVDRQSSYLGASSIKAALMVMVKVSPRLRSYLMPPTAENRRTVQVRQSNNATPRHNPTPRPSPRIAWSSEGQTLIDAYFNRVQIFIPMLDEPSFRADYLGGQRHDSPWLALLNMVFAMGSIAAMKSDDLNHMNFYERSRDHLNLDCFGEGHLETLQALILTGGYYLHYINRPNMANAITGAALRMACALGLHRENGVDVNGGEREKMLADLRRRTWWSLFCLDTWASTTLGRPSLGRSGPAVTIRPPEGANDANENSTTGQHIRIVPLIENIKFARISTQIQDTMALSPLPRAEERSKLDAQLVEWSDKLPWVLRSTDPCPEALYTARCVLKWRYQNMRIVLHRPVLLNLANRGANHKSTVEEISAVELCRAMARQTIDDISREWTQNQMSGWNAVWFMYQASMIPLVSMFWESGNTSMVREWQRQIEIVLECFADMADWSLAARRSREVVSRMYEASKGPITRQGSPRLQAQRDGQMEFGAENGSGQAYQHMNDMSPGMASAHHAQQAQQMTDMMMEEGMVLLDNQSIWDLDGMLWGNLPDGLDMPFDGMPGGGDEGMQYGDHDQGQYDNSYMMNQG
ncbi:hypothetical protein V496_01148 [Pseudogymnoascus sp. VKM F-4515 (FW-2607)]|nr:hypothetical protein V496_01148 [Pseudogymnoascus sp. VKM F-4515 (FW-2607)]